MTKSIAAIAAAALAVGYTVRETPSGSVEIYKRHRRNNTVIRGVVIFPNGTALDATVPLSSAKAIRTHAGIRAVLGLD
jgi:hypothetical protein